MTRRQHRAALAIQTAWRGHTARANFRRTRRGVVAAQGLWRCKLARRKLRALRAEAREAGKLMQDKRFLETKVVELTSTLELVQNQRNDLRQQFRVRFLCPSSVPAVSSLRMSSFPTAATEHLYYEGSRGCSGTGRSTSMPIIDSLQCLTEATIMKSSSNAASGRNVAAATRAAV